MSEPANRLYTLPLHHFKSYLDLEKWNLVNENERWIVYEDDDAIELAIPKKRKASDFTMYVDHMLKILSFAQDKEPNIVADDILTFDLDVMGTIFDNSEGAKSISMRSADAYFSELKQLLMYSASSEEKREPCFKTALQKARKVLDHFQFGHTVQGSFGYRIESKIKADSLFQYVMFADDPEPIIPHERKVMQRIYNGLAATNRAVDTGDLSLLTEGFDSGFNANMCTALLNMAGDRREPIEYSFKWSRKIDVPDEMAGTPKIVVKRDHLEYLEEASEYLYFQHPEHTDIIGLVNDLSIKNSPNSGEIGTGAITIERLTPEGRTQKVHTVVDGTSHLNAIDAYKARSTVGIKGNLVYKQSKWRLTNPEELRIVST